MKKIIISICVLCAFVGNTSAQNVGINNTNPQAALDLQGDLRLRSATLTLPANLNNDVDLTTVKSSVYMFAGGALTGCQITGFTGGVDGRVITIFNNSTTNAIQLYDESNATNLSTATNKILTGTANSAVIYGNGSVTLRYDGIKQRWIVMNSAYTDGLSLVTAGAGPWTVAGNNIANSNSGNVGIGNGTPAFKLDVKTTATAAISTYSLSTGEFGYGLIARSDNKGIGVLGEAYQGSAVGGYFIADGNGTETAMKAETLNGGTAAYLNSPTGKALIVNQGTVGIGEPAPLEKLHVNNGNVKIGNALWASATDDRFLKIGDGPYVSIGEVGGDDLMEVRGKQITIRSNPASPFGSAGNVLIPNGNVGIGTLNPTFKLSVNGTIRSKELRINTGWADYVFEDNYKLMPLAEVEKYIKKNKHLPEIPEASLLQKEGVDVSAMQTKMMAKIEELTLYLIEANKQIEILKKKLNIP
jgi:hypothetical protein